MIEACTLTHGESASARLVITGGTSTSRKSASYLAAAALGLAAPLSNFGIAEATATPRRIPQPAAQVVRAPIAASQEARESWLGAGDPSCSKSSLGSIATIASPASSLLKNAGN